MIYEYSFYIRKNNIYCVNIEKGVINIGKRYIIQKKILKRSHAINSFEMKSKFWIIENYNPITHITSVKTKFTLSFLLLTLLFLLCVHMLIIIMGSSTSKQSGRLKTSSADNVTPGPQLKDRPASKILNLEPKFAKENRSFHYDNFDTLQKEYDSLSNAYQLKESAYQLKAQYKYDIALELYKKSMAIYEEIKGKDSSCVADILAEGIGIIYERQRKYQAALEAFARAKEIYKKNKGEESQFYVISLNDIGCVYLEMEQYDEAFKYYEQALALWQRLEGILSLQAGKTLQLIGLVYRGKGEYPKALQYLKRNLQIQQRAGVGNQNRAANTHHNIGFTYFNLEDYQNALDHFQKNVQIKLSVMEKDNVEVAFAKMYIGNVRHKQKDLPGAVEMYKQTIAIYEKHQVRNRDYAGTYLNLGIVYRVMKEYGSAATAFRVCLPVFEQMNCPDDVKKSALGLARSLRLLGEKQQLEQIKLKYGVKL